MGLAQILKAEYGDIVEEEAAGMPEFTSQADVDQYIAKLETEMREAAKKFEFEKAARLRDTSRNFATRSSSSGSAPSTSLWGLEASRKPARQFPAWKPVG